MTDPRGINMKESESINSHPGTLLDATLEPLIEPVPGTSPGGPNLENDREFMAFETDAQGRPAQYIGDEESPAVPPNWVEIQARAEKLLMRSKDLRVALIYTRANIALNGLAGFEAGLHLLRELVVRFWDTLHPELKANAPGEWDASFRCNVLSAFCGPAFLRAVRDLPVVQMRGPVPTVREIEQAERGELPVPTLEQQRKQLDTAVREQRAGVEVALRLPGAVSALENALKERCFEPAAPRFEQLARATEALALAAGNAFAREATEAAATAAEALGAAVAPAGESGGNRERVPAAPRGVHPVTARLNSRADAIALLDAVSAFLEQSEPAHPAPLLIRRASALLGMDFLGVMRELVPDALNQVRVIAGIGIGAGAGPN